MEKEHYKRTWNGIIRMNWKLVISSLKLARMGKPLRIDDHGRT